jgi:hypothetical protein
MDVEGTSDAALAKPMSDGPVDAEVDTGPERRGLMEFKGRLPHGQRERTEVMRVEGPSPADQDQRQSISNKVGAQGW